VKVVVTLTYAGVVLAGGESERMGRDKRRLTISGQTLLAQTIARLRPLVDEMLVVVRERGELPPVDARIVTDQYAGMGVLAGVHAGLAATRAPWAYVVAGDMPLLNADLLRAMAALTDKECDVVVPRWRGELEPLHALYRPAACAPAAEAALRASRRRVIAFYPQVRVREIEEDVVLRLAPQGHSFFNVNTETEWTRLQALLKQHSTQSVL
jgi:molybdopterin-guanine dinucleotide biosynthesis protein A